MFVVFLDRPLTNTPLEPLGTIAPLMAFFLWEKKKRRWKERGGRRQQHNKKSRRGEKTKTKTQRGTNVCLDTMAGLFSLSLGLIRLLVEMKAMGEDSGASDESVCAVIALIKRAV